MSSACGFTVVRVVQVQPSRPGTGPDALRCSVSGFRHQLRSWISAISQATIRSWARRDCTVSFALASTIATSAEPRIATAATVSISVTPPRRKRQYLDDVPVIVVVHHYFLSAEGRHEHPLPISVRTLNTHGVSRHETSSAARYRYSPRRDVLGANHDFRYREITGQPDRPAPRFQPRTVQTPQLADRRVDHEPKLLIVASGQCPGQSIELNDIADNLVHLGPVQNRLDSQRNGRRGHAEYQQDHRDFNQAESLAIHRLTCLPTVSWR
jgi:hypothetical protein